MEGPIILALAGALIPLVAPGATAPGVWRMSESGVLGSEANFVVTARDGATAQEAIFAARAEIERLDAVFNSHRADSALSRMDRSDADLTAVLDRAAHWTAISGGAFDPKVEGRLCLDAIAKGYIVDCAAAAAKAVPGVQGVLVDIGGDMRAIGQGPDRGGWTVGLTDPALPYLNAPPAARVRVKDGAIATSSRGLRDPEVNGRRVSAIIDPPSGRSASANLCATVLAGNAADADALATALFVLPAHEGLALAHRLPGVEARITDAAGGVHRSAGWSELALADTAPKLVRVADAPNNNGKWMPDWALELLYQAPNKQDNRDPDFRSPYMALWISDKAGNPIRTITLVGTDTKYHKENYVWWNSNKAQAAKLVELRSGQTSLSGRYSLFWPGYDDNWKFVPQGEYVLHVETSQEHGKHTHRTMPLTLGPKGFTTTMKATPDGGGLAITYGKRD